MQINTFTKKENKNLDNRGYTIIETMISIAVFLVVVVIGIGALLQTNTLHQKSQDMRSILDNMSFVAEDMSRNMRTGYNFHCGDFSNIEEAKSCALGGNVFFESANGGSGSGDQWGYKIEAVSGSNYNISKTVNGGATWVQLNPDEVVMESFSGFTVLGATSPTSGDQQQPLVIIRLVGKITYKNVVTPFSIQTTVSQRLIDN